MSILYYILFGFLWIISFLPLEILHFISNFIYIIIYYVVKYRRTVVRKSLTISFPEKSDIEIKKIEKDFYKHFCDYFFETIKLINMSESDVKKRVKILNPELIDNFYKNNKSVFLYLGHYGNWEWLSYAWSVIRPELEDYKMYIAYYPLGNKHIEKFFYNLRSKKSNGIPIAQRKILRTIIKLNQEEKKGIFIFIADQSPTRNNVLHWLQFLKQDTAPIVGPEKLAKQTGYPSLYFKVKRIKRGYYSGEFIKLEDDPKKVPDYEITDRYFNELEKSIKEDPPLWLWTHRRWKFKKSEFIKK